MSVLTALIGAALFFAGFPALLYFRNTKLFRPPAILHTDNPLSPPQVSVLIPARNEEKSIGAALHAVLLTTGVELEVIVLDDHSTDGTAKIVQECAANDARVRLEQAPDLPDGWCGKQHACYTLAKHAKFPILTFLDADVRLAPDAIARMVGFLTSSNTQLVSGFPRQETGTLLEKLVIPLINWLLMCYLPMATMRKDKRPGFGAGCGQWFMTRREDYDTIGGHSAVKSSYHDGVKLPRAYRSAGMTTDVCDATNLATCRMYHDASQVWFGLAKNAGEGLGSPKLIGVWTILLFTGHVLPFLLLAAYSWLITWERIAVCAAIVLCYLPRFDAAIRFRQSWLGAVMHPVGIAVLLGIQWYSLIRTVIGKPVGWKGRTHPNVLHP